MAIAMHFRIALILIAATFSGAIYAVEQSSEDVLKSNGLSKVRSQYLLNADAKLPESLSGTYVLQRKVEITRSKRSEILKDIEHAEQILNDLNEQNEELTAKLEK